MKRLFDWLPTLAAAGLLAAVIALGVQRGVAGSKQSGEKAHGDWCEPHRVPEKDCIECNAGLAPKRTTFGWCGEHGIAECPHCQPASAELTTLPDVSPGDKQRLARARAVMAAEEENSPSCKLRERRLQLTGADDLRLLGIAVATVERRPISDTATVAGQVVADPTRLVRVSPRVSGTVTWLRATVGQRVEVGETIALVESPQVAKVRGQFMQARAQLARSQRALDALWQSPGTTTMANLRTVEAEVETDRLALAAAERACAVIGVEPEEAAALTQPPRPARNLAPVRSPASGVIAETNASLGATVEAGKPLATVVDPQRAFVQLGAPADLAERIRIGQNVRFQNQPGVIRWLSPEVDSATRTVAVRVELDGSLMPGATGQAEITLRHEADAITVPASAVHHEGCCTIVFVRDRDWESTPSRLLFHVRTVRTGTRTDGRVEILAGLLPGEIVAAEGSGQFRAELLKAGIGQGCCAGH